MAFAKATVRRFCHLGAFLTLLQMTLLSTVVAGRRPFYIIGNMVNSIYDVDVFLNDGANALQADVTFSHNGRAQYFYHGTPCDCYRSCTRDSTVQDYLNYLRDVTSKSGGKYEGKVALLYLALQTSSISEESQYQAGADIASKLMNYLWRNVSPKDGLNVLLYVSSTAEKKVFKGVLDTIPAPWSDHIGFDFGGLESFAKISEAYAELNISGHRWLGSGNSNCLPYLSGRYARLEAIVDCREGKLGVCDVVDKGYAYNLDTKRSIAREIRLGLDAVITNYPKTAREVIEWNDIERLVRLAGPSDSPWERITD